MGLPSSPQLDKFTRWFLFLAHLQHRLVGVTDNSKVLNYFAMLLPRSLRARRLSVLTMGLRYYCTIYFIEERLF
jgi:hypothetical protein